MYVPNEAKSAYQAAAQWQDFFFIEDLPTGIDDIIINDCNDDTPNIYYDLNGRVVENPTKGIYILDGKKVLKK